MKLPAIVNVQDVLVIGVIALIFCWLFNRALRMVGLGDFATDAVSTDPASAE